MLKILQLLRHVSKKTWAFLALLLSMVGFSGLFRRCQSQGNQGNPENSRALDALNEAGKAQQIAEEVAQSSRQSHEQTERAVGNINQQLQTLRAEEKQKMSEIDQLSADELANYPRKPR